MNIAKLIGSIALVTATTTAVATTYPHDKTTEILFDRSFTTNIQFDHSFVGEQFLGWKSLAIPFDDMENPFKKIPYEQLSLLRDYSTLKDRINDDSQFTKSNIELFKEQADEIETKLQDEGLSASEMYEKRNKIMEYRLGIANTPNPKVINKHWKIAGFMAPIEYEGNKVTRFFMVQTAGACIHTPAPPPNQIVMVTYEEGVEIEGLENGFWVEGILEAEPITDVASYYDGETVVDAIYKMDATKIVFFE